jgi:hypothetical protein
MLIYNSPSDFNFFSNFTDNLDLPAQFGSAEHGFDGSCMFGFKQVYLRSQENSIIYFNLQTLPVSNKVVNANNNASNPNAFFFSYRIRCFD